MTETEIANKTADKLMRGWTDCPNPAPCQHCIAFELESAYVRGRAELAAAEERGRRAEHERARGVIHVLHQCIRGKCDCGPGQFACEETARTVIDSWDADRARKV